ncbi:MAG: GTPase domain-containing protein [Cyanobacteria bacterium Co-bin13]|nr:GTPase domain-containing protein [Cyanobacteria bacterium Co-bin13]
MLAKRPILVGGLGLSATLWLLDAVHLHFFDASTLLSAIALSSGIWWWRRQGGAPQPVEPKLTVADRPAVERAVAQLSALRAALATAIETTLSPTAQASWQAALAAFEQQIADLKTGLERQTLQIGLVGEPLSGKSTLLSHLQNGSAAAELGTVSLNFQELPLPADPAAVSDALTHQDAIFFLTTGDLTDSAYSFLKQRLLAGQRLVLVFNKQDQYLPTDRESVLQQLQQRVAGLPLAVKVVAIAAAPPPH